MKALKIMLICCWVSTATMIPRTRDEMFQNRGNMERVLRSGSIEDCVYLLLGIKHYNDS